MNTDLGNIGQGGQQIQVNVKDAVNVECENCENIFFDRVTVIKKISKLLVGTTEDQYVPMETYKCTECGNINKDFKI